MEKWKILARVYIFSSLSETDLKRIADLAQEHELEKDTLVINEGEHDARLFITVSGELDVIKNRGLNKERVVRHLKPYDYFGEMALIDDLERSASVIVTSRTRLLSLSQERMQQEMVKHPLMTISLLKTMSKRVRAIEKSMAQILGELLPICANCKKIRQEDGSWIQIEKYISGRSETDFTHGICPDCARELYPTIYPNK